MKRFSAPAWGTLCLIGQPLLLNVIGIPATAFIIRKLGPVAYGQWAVATTLIATVMFLTNVGLRMHFIREVARQPETAGKALAEQLGLRTLLALLAASIAVLAAAAMRYPAVVIQCTAVAALGLVLTCVATTASDLLQAQSRLSAMAGVNLAGGIALTLASVAVIAAGGGPLQLSAAYLMGPAVSAVLALATVHRHCCRVRISFGVHRSFALLWQSRLLASQLGITTIASQAEALLVPKLVGIGSYGFYSAGWLLSSRLGIIPDAVVTGFYPAFARAYGESARAAAREVARAAVIILALCVSAATAAFLLAGPVAQLLFPEREALCRQVIQITVWWLPLQGLAGMMGYALNAAHREADETRLAIQSNLISLCLSAVLISSFGVVGAAWAAVARGLVGSAIRFPCLLRTYPPVLSEMPLVLRGGVRAAFSGLAAK
ncbi:MAG: oligosaccharide flippase family protein [Actinomycetota bacterium]